MTGGPGRLVFQQDYELSDQFEDSVWEDRYDVRSVGYSTIEESDGVLRIDAVSNESASTTDVVFQRVTQPANPFHTAIDLAFSSESEGNAAGHFVLIDQAHSLSEQDAYRVVLSVMQLTEVDAFGVSQKRYLLASGVDAINLPSRKRPLNRIRLIRLK